MQYYLIVHKVSSIAIVLVISKQKGKQQGLRRALSFDRLGLLLYCICNSRSRLDAPPSPTNFSKNCSRKQTNLNSFPLMPDTWDC